MSARGDDFSGHERVYRLRGLAAYTSVMLETWSCDPSWTFWYRHGLEICPEGPLVSCRTLINGDNFNSWDSVLLDGADELWIVVEGYQTEAANFKLSVECI